MEGKKINLRAMRGFPMLFKVEKNEDGTRTVFGCYPDNEINPGDEMLVPADNGTFIVQSVERRDVTGNYSADVNRKNAHFEAVCSYQAGVK